MKAAGKMVVGILALPVVLALGYLYTQREPAKSQFYVVDDLDWDLWEIPIIDPHRLIASISRSNLGDEPTRWAFARKNSADNFNPDSINYEKGIITFHDPVRNKYGFYDLNQDKTNFLISYKQFRNFTQANKLASALFEVEAVYSCWNDTRQLPWAKEIFIENYSSTTHK
ncbi:hypothetical protein GCM10027422_35660 [Hymenobacter arcticus]